MQRKFEPIFNKMLYKEPKAKALIFDLDGTLIDSMPLHFKAWSHVCKKYQLYFPETMFLNFAGNSAINIATSLINDAKLELDVLYVIIYWTNGGIHLAQVAPIC